MRALAPLLAMFAAPLVAQTGVMPVELRTHFGDDQGDLPLRRTAGRFQQIYERKVLPADLTAGKRIVAIALRHAAAFRLPTKVTHDLEIGMFNTRQDRTTMTNNFATNRQQAASGGVVFRRKKVSLPEYRPAAPERSWLPPIILDTPLTFAGPNLMVEFVTFDANGSRAEGWRMDYAVDRTAGRTWPYGIACGSTATTLGARSNIGMKPGARITYSLGRSVPNAATVFALGGSASRLVGLPLPFDLTPIGAKDCAIYTSAELIIPLVVDAQGSASIVVRVPANPALDGLKYYTQWFTVDPAANALKLAASAGLLSTLGPITYAHGVNTWSFDPAAATGRGPNRGQVPVTRLFY